MNGTQHESQLKDVSAEMWASLLTADLERLYKGFQGSYVSFIQLNGNSTSRDSFRNFRHIQDPTVQLNDRSTSRGSSRNSQRSQDSIKQMNGNGMWAEHRTGAQIASVTPQGLEAALPEEDASQIKPPDIPDGGLQAWLTVLGCFFLWFNSMGLTNAFGVFQTYYQTELLRNQTPSQISWIGALQLFILIFFGVLTGPAFDAGYCNLLIRLGTALVVLGYMMVSLCTEYWQVMLAQGVFIGFGTACLFLPSTAVLPQYFDEKRAFANGLAASGSSLGGVIYPIVLYKLIPEVGFGWAVRILGFIVLGTGAFSIAVVRVRVNAPKRRFVFDSKTLKQPAFVFLCFSYLFAYMGLYNPSFYIQSFAIDKGILGGDLSAYILSIANAAGFFGRIVPNMFADRTGPLNMLIPCLALAGIIVLAWIAVVNEGGLILFALMYGFFSGLILSLPPMGVVWLCPNIATIGTHMGIASSFCAFGVLMGTPVAGTILGTSGNYVGLQIFTGVILLISAMFCGTARMLKVGPHLLVEA